ncbi:hypothetical protein AB0M35_10680 [Micromonospora sp. NPDC051196]|uniref:hypothetical protein n=1 Tax=Micromonospora sp. NPDC051196 TaxID=3155281 RepID=UPI003426DEA2
MRLSRIIMALTVGLAVVAVPAVAGAAPQPSPTVTDPAQPPTYTPQLPSLTVNRPTIYLGETVILTGRNFGRNVTVDIVVTVQSLAAPAADTARRSDGSTVAMAPVAYQPTTADRFSVGTNTDGLFTREYTPRVTGLITFTAETDRRPSIELRVLPKKKPHLPVTGSSLDTPMKVGGGLVAAGTVMLLGTMLWRRRNRFGVGGAR